jgi:hypothetical protein
MLPREDLAEEPLVFQLAVEADPVPGLLLFKLLVPEEVEFIEPEPVVPVEAVPEALDEPEPAVPAFAEPEAAIDPEADPSAFTPAPVVVEAFMPELADVLFVLRVLLQFASTIASGNTKNTFFITWSFLILATLVK